MMRNSLLVFVGFCLVILASPGGSCSSRVRASVLSGLMGSQYTMWVDFIKKASVMGDLKHALGRHNNVTILAPENQWFTATGGQMFRRFLEEEGNSELLKRVIEFHMIPHRITADTWPASAVAFKALSTDPLLLWTATNGGLKVGINVNVVDPDAVICNNGVIHGVDSFLVPKIIQNTFESWRKRSIPP